MFCRLGSATLSELYFPGRSDPNFPWDGAQWDNTVAKRKKERKKGGKKEREKERKSVKEPYRVVARSTKSGIMTSSS